MMSCNVVFPLAPDPLTGYFVSGCKSDCRLGLELEHFIVERGSKKAVPYAGDAGVGAVLRELAAEFPQAVLGQEPLLGFVTPEFSVSLEPASQLEISVVPLATVGEVERVYAAFRARLDGVLAKHGYEAVRCGYQPASRAGELPLIPKRRYELMDAYFKTSGTRGVYMMRGTASTQVSVDFRDETDFRRKMQAACFLSPYLALLTDNVPVFEGAPNEMRLRRSWVWEDVDARRCGIVPGVMRDDFGFADYAAYLRTVPPIFVPADCAADSVQMLEHLVSIVFPAVRLKRYLEIRPADSMDPDRVFAYLALLKGLLYNEGFLDQVQSEKHERRIDGEAIRTAARTLARDGWNALLYGRTVGEWHETFLQTAKDRLTERERDYLKPFEVRK